MPRKLTVQELEPRVAPSAAAGIGLATFVRSLFSNVETQFPDLAQQLRGFVHDTGDTLVVEQARDAAGIANSFPLNPGLAFKPGGDRLVLNDLSRVMPLRPFPL
ncbi:MAG: hypothetical protein D6718_10590 [Acidobacteria bacterium]|nr:MAG: hypothetical protein D6718_10590 [Acidobacteriota bacterium]